MTTTYYSSLAALAEEPSASAVWWTSVARALDELSERLNLEALVDEGPEGALDEAVSREPSLSNRATKASRDLATLMEHTREVRRLVTREAGNPDHVADVAAQLLVLARAEEDYRRHVRSVVWDSLTRDIGGE
jgi:hypothetical protein